MKFVVRIWLLGFLLLIAAIHCSTTANGFVVVVNSDIPKSDIDEVRITVSREGQSPQIKSAKDPAFPLTLGVTSDPGDRVAVSATGLRGGNVVVENFANATVQDDEQRMLVLDLCRECEGLACNGDFVCVTSTTCSAPGVDSTALPKWADSPPKTACQPGDRPKRESSQTTAPPPVTTNDGGGDSGPIVVSEAGPSEAGFSDAGHDIVDPPKCDAPLDVTTGGTYKGTTCAEISISSQCNGTGNNWSLVAFAVNTLPPGKHYAAMAILDSGKEIGFAPYTGDCKVNYGTACQTSNGLQFNVAPNTKFVLAQRGQLCEAYTLTLTLQSD